MKKEMKLPKSEGEEICKIYNLGKLIKIIPLTEGWVNDSFLLETEKGKYVALFLHKFNNWRRERLRLQFKVLNYLKQKNFPYKIPYPIKNNRNTYFSDYKKRKFWVYPYIEGETKNHVTKEQFLEIARVLAEYHKYVKKLGDQGDKEFLEGFSYLKDRYNLIKTKKPKTKLDNLVIKNLPLFQEILNKIKKMDYSDRILVHADFKPNNLIYKNNKIIGIIDFDNESARPIGSDIALTVSRTNYLKKGWDNKKLKIFLQEYEKINKLSKKEKDLIIPCLLQNYCNLFQWFYTMRKNKDKAYYVISETIEDTKKAMEDWKR